MNENLRDSAFKAQCLSGLMMPIMNFIGNFGYVAVCIVGAVLAMNGKISFGVIVAFMIYIRLFTQPLSQIAQAMVAAGLLYALGGPLLSPMFAGAAMSLSSVCVVGNALRLGTVKL